jgi:hypothetical protein
MDDDERVAQETQASVDEALESIGAPDYTAPAAVVEQHIRTVETRGDHGSPPTQTISIESRNEDGSRTNEYIESTGEYHEFTTYPDGSQTYHDVDARGTTEGSTSYDAAGGRHNDEERSTFSSGEVRTTHTETPPELTPEDLQELEGL